MAKKSAKTQKQASQSEEVVTDTPPRSPKQQTRAKDVSTKSSSSWLPGLAAIGAVAVAVALLWEFPINPYKSHTPAAPATESQAEVAQAAPKVVKKEMDPQVFSELKRAQGEFLQGEFKKVCGLCTCLLGLFVSMFCAHLLFLQKGVRECFAFDSKGEFEGFKEGVGSVPSIVGIPLQCVG